MQYCVRFYSSKDVYGKVLENMSVISHGSGKSVVRNVWDAKKVEIKS